MPITIEVDYFKLKFRIQELKQETSIKKQTMKIVKIKTLKKYKIIRDQEKKR